MKDFLNAIASHIKNKHTPESESRATICGGCPNKEKRFYSEIFKSKMKNIKGYVCIDCDCPISTKIFAKQKENICKKWL